MDFDPEDKNNIFLQNIGLCLQDFLAMEGQEFGHNSLHRLDRCLFLKCWIIYPFGGRAGYLILVCPLCNMWIAFEPKYVKLWNTWHFVERKKLEICEACLKKFCKYICWLSIWMWPLIVKEGAVNKKPLYDDTKHTNTVLRCSISMQHS